MNERPRPIEGLDFYREGPCMIFTERYHLQRGWCCQGRCRHCPWKEVNKEPVKLNVSLINQDSPANDKIPDDVA